MATNENLRTKIKTMTDTVRPTNQGEIIEFPGRPENADAQRLHRCPCCGCRTLRARGGFETCPVCAWSDAGRDERDADLVNDGPNGPLSLRQARANYRRFGASEAGHVGRVRRPRPEEL
jgi:cysteine-rich CPCC protein